MKMRQRWKNSADLFGRGAGSGTYGDCQCEWCGNKYNEGEDKRGIYDGDSVGYVNFAGKFICDCCFGHIEEEIWHRRSDLLTWMEARLREIWEVTEDELDDAQSAIKTLGKIK